MLETQPFFLSPCILINKYLGFEQLKFLSESYEVNTLATTEIRNDRLHEIRNKLIKYSDDELLTVRTASISRWDFGLPSIMGCSKNIAIEWILKTAEEHEDFAFFVSPYFKSYISGKIQIDLLKTRIEFSLGDFDAFSKGFIDITLEKYLLEFYRILKASDKLKKNLVEFQDIIISLCHLANKLASIYKEDLKSGLGVTYEFDFSYGNFENDDAKFLKLISMRTYCFGNNIG